MSAVDILKKVKSCEKNIVALESALLSFEKTYKRVKSEDIKKKILETKCLIDKEITEQAIIKIKSYPIIQSLSNPIERQVLIYHFICCMTLEETAIKLNYSCRQTFRIYQNACRKANAHYKAQMHNI